MGTKTDSVNCISLFERYVVVSIRYLCLLIAIGGCTSSIVSTPLVQRTYPNGLVGEKKILITGFEKEGGKCLKAEMYDYMKGTNKFDLINPTEQMSEREFEEFVEREKIDLVISGEMEMYTIGSSVL